MPCSDATAFHSIVVPQELEELIIDNLWEDKTALKICSLVTKAWAARSRRHLFYEVEILTDGQLDSWTRLFPYPGESDAACLVRRLHIHKVHLLEDISKLNLKQFRNVVHFSLEMTPFHQSRRCKLSDSIMRNILLLPVSLRSLRLVLGRICALDVTSLCGRFQDLDDFSLHCILLNSRRSTPEGAALVSSPNFRGKLSVSIIEGSSCLFDIFAALPNGVRFSHISLFMVSNITRNVSAWLLSVAKTLTSLEIDVSVRVISEFPSPRDTIIDLSPLSKLSTFSLRFKPTLLHPSTIAQTIESAPCTVSKIELIFALNPKTNGEWIPVDNATVALASRCSRTFRTVVKGIQKDEMKKLFPKSSSMDFFQVD